VHRIGRGGQNAAHSGAGVEAVGAPERWELIPLAGLGAPPESIRAVACRAYLGKHLRTMAEIGGTRRRLILNVPAPTSFAPSGMPVDSHRT